MSHKKYQSNKQKHQYRENAKQNDAAYYSRLVNEPVSDAVRERFYKNHPYYSKLKEENENV